MNTPDKCPHCGAEVETEGPWSPIWKCGSSAFDQSKICIERAIHAETEKQRFDLSVRLLAAELRAKKAEARVAELEELRVKVEKFEPYYLDYISSVSAAGLPADGPCLACNGFGGHEEGCHGTTGLMTMAYELEILRARVAELEGLKNHTTGDEKEMMTKFVAFVPDSRLAKEFRGRPATLGQAMPRKEVV